eukprot:379716-Amphidinium_carterae.1
MPAAQATTATVCPCAPKKNTWGLPCSRSSSPLETPRMLTDALPRSSILPQQLPEVSEALSHHLPKAAWSEFNGEPDVELQPSQTSSALSARSMPQRPVVCVPRKEDS